MANRIIAVDLGAWSVKVAIAQPGLRHATLSSYHERPVPAADLGNPEESWESRASRALAQVVREAKVDHDNVYLAVPGDHVFTHVLEFPFKTLRRADLEKAVGAELENVVPVDLENMVYAFEALPPDPPAPIVDPGAPTRGRVAAPSAGMRVLTYAMAVDKAEAWLKLSADAGAPARSLIPEAGPMARLVDRLPSLATARASGAIAVVDLGHARTDVVVVRASRAVHARTIARGGRHLTEAVQKHWKLPWAEAEQAKHTDGFVASAAMPATSEAWARVSEVMQGELQLLLRELRQTFAACRAKTGTAVASVLLVGGGSRLRGLAAWLGEQLGAPVATIDDAEGSALLGPRIAGQASAAGAALCLGMVADAESARPLLDLRQGSLSHKVDLTFLRAKAPVLALALTLITASATTSAWFAHKKLRKAETVLTERVALESTVEFGDPKTADEINNTASGQVTEAASPLPAMTAWDILLDITQRMPARDKVTLDVDKIEIDASKVVIEGTAKSPEEVDLIEAALKEQKCFETINRGATQATADGKRKFEFSIKSGCM